MFVRPSVRLFVCYKLLYGERWIDILYTDRRGIYPDVSLANKICDPTDRSDVISQRLDAIGQKREKTGFFERFFN